MELRTITVNTVFCGPATGQTGSQLELPEDVLALPTEGEVFGPGPHFATGGEVNDAVEALEKNEIYLRDVLVSQAATIEQLQAQMAQMEATHKAEMERLLAMVEKLLKDRKSQAPSPNALKLAHRFNAKDTVPVRIRRFGQGDGDRKQITLPKEVAALLKDARGPKFKFSKRPRKVKQRTAGTLDAGGQQGTGRR